MKYSKRKTNVMTRLLPARRCYHATTSRRTVGYVGEQSWRGTLVPQMTRGRFSCQNCPMHELIKASGSESPDTMVRNWVRNPTVRGTPRLSPPPVGRAASGGRA